MSPSSAADSGPVGVAINVGANSTLPGFRGPLFPDGSFDYVPIPERKPTTGPVPTYGDLDIELPEGFEDRPVHLDPSFAEYTACETYTYGDEHGVKATPLGRLRAGDFVWFYASLAPRGEPPPWAPRGWGAFVIGEFRLTVDPLSNPNLSDLPEAVARACRTNAHFKRSTPDAKVVLLGDPAESSLFDRAVPLSAPSGGVEPNRRVTRYSSDSGQGPWWRRPLRYDAAGTRRLRDSFDDPRP